MKKVTSKQNIAIIVLSVLLLISIGFGATYSYFNGRSGELKNTGRVTMATLTVDFDYDGKNDQLPSGQTTPFTLHSKGTSVVPGAPLSNYALEIINSSPVDTYMIVVYSLKIFQTVVDESGEERETIVNAPSDMEAMDIQSASVGDGWRKQILQCRDEESIICMLVYLGDNTSIPGKGDGNGIFSKNTPEQKTTVLDSECLKVPESWDNLMQGKTISLTFTAYVLQAQSMTNTYPKIDPSETPDPDQRAKAIAEMFVDAFGNEIDKTSAPVEEPGITPAD